LFSRCARQIPPNPPFVKGGTAWAVPRRSCAAVLSQDTEHTVWYPSTLTQATTFCSIDTIYRYTLC